MWPWRKRKLVEDIKTVTEIAGDQIAPGAGKLALIVGGRARGAAGACLLHKRHKNKKAAR